MKIGGWGLVGCERAPFPSLKTEGNGLASTAVIEFEIARLGQSPEIRRLCALQSLISTPSIDRAYSAYLPNANNTFPGRPFRWAEPEFTKSIPPAIIGPPTSSAPPCPARLFVVLNSRSVS